MGERINRMLRSAHQVGDDDGRREARERFERIELRAPRALRHAADPIRKIARIVVVAQASTVRASPLFRAMPKQT
jgi:hypothetical protein